MLDDCRVALEAYQKAVVRFERKEEVAYEGCAHQLCRMYNAIEQMGLRLAKVFENNIDDEQGWHSVARRLEDKEGRISVPGQNQRRSGALNLKGRQHGRERKGRPGQQAKITKANIISYVPDELGQMVVGDGPVRALPEGPKLNDVKRWA